MNYQKKKENKINDKVKINSTTSPDTPNASDQDDGSTDSNSPFSCP